MRLWLASLSCTLSSSHDVIAGTEIPIYIVNDHHDAGTYWRNLSRQPGVSRSVFHVDTHSDMFLDFNHRLRASKKWRPPSESKLAKILESTTNIGNFISAAVFDKIVDAVVWLRSDFAIGRYNGPPPGHYEKIIGMPDYSKRAHDGGPPIRNEHHGAPLLLYTFVKHKNFHKFRGGMVLTQGEQQIAAPAAKCIYCQGYKPQYFIDRPFVPGLVTFNLSVLTAPQLESPGMTENVFRRMYLARNSGGEWILDIDLDYFSSFAENFVPVMVKHSWSTSRTEANAFAEWAITLSQILVMSYEWMCGRTSVLTAIELYYFIDRLPFLTAKPRKTQIADEVMMRARSQYPRCTIPYAWAEDVSRIVVGLSKRQRQQWAELDEDDWQIVLNGLIMPYDWASASAIRSRVVRLKSILQRFPHAPKIVTISRSLGSYLPPLAAPLIEWEVLLMLRSLWSSGHEKLPENLEDLTTQQVARLLEGVIFHTTKNGTTLSSQPWPLKDLRKGKESEL